MVTAPPASSIAPPSPTRIFTTRPLTSDREPVADELTSYLDAWGDLLAVVVEQRATHIVGETTSSAERLSQAIAECRAALTGEAATLRESVTASQRDAARVGRELVRAGATLEALRNAVDALRPALEQGVETASTALVRDVARDLARERQLREAAERSALDDILAALDGLEHNLEAAGQLVGTPGAGWREPAAQDASWRRRPLARAWLALGKLIGVPADGNAAPLPTAGVDSLVDGIQITYRRLLDTLARRGVTAIQATGTPFDPHLHEAVGVEPCAEPQDGLVLREQRRGYRTAESVVRLAQVVVGRAQA